VQAALGERVETLEIARGGFGKGGDAAPAEIVRASGSDRPQLDVVRLSPNDGDGDADVGGARPVVRAVGAEGSIQSKKGEKPIVLRGGFFRKTAVPTPPKKNADGSSDLHPTVNP
jgi:hypothetical protein